MPEPQGKKPSLADIATRVGVSPMTVSRALRGLPKVSPELQERIVKVAAEMGYHHDMEISRVMRLMRQSRSDAFYETVAFLGLCPKDLLRPGGGFFAEILRGARTRAEQLCYGLNEFHLEDYERKPARLQDIIRSRGIRGVLLSPRMHPDDSLPFDFGGLIPVGIGHTHPAAHFNLVRFNHFSGMALCCRALRARGYRKLALVADADVNRRMEGRFSAAFITHCGEGLEPTGKERLLLETPLKPESVIAFLRTHQPDAVIGGHSSVFHWITQSGIRVPEDMAFATMNFDATLPFVAGIDQRYEDWGARALDLLTSLLHQSERSVADASQSILVEGNWRDGGSAPAR